MINFLLKRPIAVTLFFIVFMGFGIFSFTKIPISLLPSIEIPKIIVKISYPNKSVGVIEENVTKPIRETLRGLEQLNGIKSISTNHTSNITLDFNYGSRMDLTYVEINERLDRIIGSLPPDLPRPRVVKINTSDVPILRIQVLPKNSSSFLQVSALTEKVIKKRLEQISGISLVDINGSQQASVSIAPKTAVLSALGLSQNDLSRIIQNSNLNLGSMMVKDGLYQYIVKLENQLTNLDQIANLPVKLKDGSILKMKELAVFSNIEEEAQGYHVYNGKQGLVITVHKQSNAKMNELSPILKSAIGEFKHDYPEIDFRITQDQSFLLNDAIQNLTQDLYYGGAFCVVLLFLLLGNYQAPLMMSLSIPTSLILTFIFFYLFNISFNIISLSGLALGIGMLIDNSIVVIDSIIRKRKEGLDMNESCIIGVRDVFSPVLSNVLTTIAIYAPLVYLSGLAGELVYDQAIALTISLTVSLLIAFCLTPVMFKFLMKVDAKKLRDDTIFFAYILKLYTKFIEHVFKNKIIYFLLAVAVMPLAPILFKALPITTLPRITETESTLKVSWNRSIGPQENLNRVTKLSTIFDKNVKEWEAEIGISQFFFQEQNGNIDQATIYFKCSSEYNKNHIDSLARKWIAQNHPEASISIQSAPNAFTQLFRNENPYLECRYRQLPNYKGNSQHDISSILETLKKHKYHLGLGFLQEQTISLHLNEESMSVYDVNRYLIEDKLKQMFSQILISEMKNYDDIKPISFQQNEFAIDEISHTTIQTSSGGSYPLTKFVSFSYNADVKYVTADEAGKYQSITIDKNEITDMNHFQEEIKKNAALLGFDVAFTGEFKSNAILRQEMTVIFLISLIMVYLILAIQFENLLHPLIVMGTIPLGLAGALIILWLQGGGLDIMSAIGIIMVLGIIVDDPSLKVETINRLRKEFRLSGMTNEREILVKALKDAGKMCLKPLLMVSLTTTLALIPVLFMGGIGNELQRPMVYVIVGGLSIGTFLTLWFIPLAYWFATKKR